jgi:hypothetical protein
LLIEAGFSGEHPFRGFLEAQSEMRTTLEHLISWGNDAPERAAPPGVLKPRRSKLLHENPPPERNIVLKHIQIDSIFQKFSVKTNFKLKMNVFLECFELQRCPIKPAVSLPNIV